MRYYLEASMKTGSVLRMLFSSRRKAENARRKITAAIEKGKFRNSGHTVDVVSDASTYTLVAEEIQSVSVNDAHEWVKHSAEMAKLAEDLGVPKAVSPA